MSHEASPFPPPRDSELTVESSRRSSVLKPARLAAVLLALPLAGCRPHDFPQYPPNYREYAYVTNGGSNTVTVLDVVNVRLDRELPVGQNPVAVAVSPVRDEVYVVNYGGTGGQGSISVIDSENNTVVGTIFVHKQPVSIDRKSVV